MTDGQSALIRKAKSSLRAAKLLTDQSFHDFAVSRSYYAMFYIVEAFLLGDGLTFSKHSSLIAEFGRRFIKSGRIPAEFHRFLIEGKDSRNVGDYDTGSGLSESDVHEQILRAEKFIELAERMIGAVP